MHAKAVTIVTTTIALYAGWVSQRNSSKAQSQVVAKKEAAAITGGRLRAKTVGENRCVMERRAEV
jgi:hypothetical protein